MSRISTKLTGWQVERRSSRGKNDSRELCSLGLYVKKPKRSLQWCFHPMVQLASLKYRWRSLPYLVKDTYPKSAFQSHALYSAVLSQQLDSKTRLSRHVCFFSSLLSLPPWIHFVMQHDGSFGKDQEGSLHNINAPVKGCHVLRPNWDIAGVLKSLQTSKWSA